MDMLITVLEARRTGQHAPLLFMAPTCYFNLANGAGSTCSCAADSCGSAPEIT